MSACRLRGTTAPLTLSGAITGSGGFIKSGADALILTGANTYAGSTGVSSGPLVLQGGSITGPGTVSVVSGASLELSSGASIGAPVGVRIDPTRRLDGVAAGPNTVRLR